MAKKNVTNRYLCANNMNLQKHISGPIFNAVSKAGETLDKPVYVIGGYVRDLLLKRKSKDLDFVILVIFPF